MTETARPASQLADSTLARLDAGSQRPPSGLWADAWRRLQLNRFAMAGAVVLLLLVLMALTAPIIAPYNPVGQDYEALRQGPSAEHLFGTDNFGRDILSRVMYGARISLTIGFLGTLLALGLGVSLGLVSGFYG